MSRCNSVHARQSPLQWCWGSLLGCATVSFRKLQELVERCPQDAERTECKHEPDSLGKCSAEPCMNRVLSTLRSQCRSSICVSPNREKRGPLSVFFCISSGLGPCCDTHACTHRSHCVVFSERFTVQDSDYLFTPIKRKIIILLISNLQTQSLCLLTTAVSSCGKLCQAKTGTCVGRVMSVFSLSSTCCRTQD